jgi:hypothetical protein
MSNFKIPERGFVQFSKSRSLCDHGAAAPQNSPCPQFSREINYDWYNSRPTLGAAFGHRKTLRIKVHATNKNNCHHSALWAPYLLVHTQDVVEIQVAVMDNIKKVRKAEFLADFQKMYDSAKACTYVNWAYINKKSYEVFLMCLQLKRTALEFTCNKWKENKITK